MNVKFSIIAILALFFGCELFAQPPGAFKSILIKKAGGAEIVYSSNSHSLILEIVSGNIKPSDKPGDLTVNNKAFQYSLTGFEGLPENEGTRSEQKRQLVGFMKREMEFAKTELKLHITGLNHDWIMLNNRLYIFWYYSLPGENKSVQKKINLSTLCFAQVLNLNITCGDSDDLDDHKAFLKNVAQTLKQNDYKIDFAARYIEIRQQ